MALRNQPYLPLYVQDFLTDEKLALCSAASNGVFIRLMCIMHKSDIYGSIVLKAKYKQNKSNISEMYAEMLSCLMPYNSHQINEALIDLVENGVIQMDDDCISQKRMTKDGELSDKRSKAGSEGGKNVKNSHTRKLYNHQGYIFLFAEEGEKDTFKIGISKKPDKRLLEVSQKTGKKMKLVYADECENMGIVEDNILNELNENRRGEWIYGLKEEEVIKVIQKQNISKSKANTEYEIEYENEIEYDNYGKESLKGKPNQTFNFQKSLTDAGADTDLLEDWMKIRKKKRAVNSRAAFAGFMREVGKSGIGLNEVLQKCCERSWSGFEAEWVDTGSPPGNGLYIRNGHQQLSKTASMLDGMDDLLQKINSEISTNGHDIKQLA